MGDQDSLFIVDKTPSKQTHEEIRSHLQKDKISSEEIALQKALFGLAPQDLGKKREKKSKKYKLKKSKKTEPESLESEKSDDDDNDDNDEEKSDMPRIISLSGKKKSTKKSRRDQKISGPVWHDEQDGYERQNLTNVSRLKKLRESPTEEEVSGSKLNKRLQEQFQRTQKGLGQWAVIKSDFQGTGKRALLRDSNDSDIQDDKDIQSTSDSELSEHDLPRSPSTIEDHKTAGKESAKTLLKELLKTTNGFSQTLPRGSFSIIPSDILGIKQKSDLNREELCQSVVKKVEFHPSGRLALTAGLDKKLRLFQVGGGRNILVQSVGINDFPIFTAHFTDMGSQIVAAGRRKFFYQIDLVSGSAHRITTLAGREEKSFQHFTVSADGSQLAFIGDNGKILLVDNKSKREIGMLKMNQPVREIVYGKAPGSNLIYSYSRHGQVYIWDVRKMQVLMRHQDEGCIHGTSFAVSLDGSYACGSDSGILNLYDRPDLTAPPNSIVRPVKSFMNITTPVDQVAFNRDGQLIAFSSSQSKNSIRIAHSQNKTVFGNWPTQKVNLERIQSLDFSPNSGYLAVGNDRGRVQMFRLLHYAQS